MRLLLISAAAVATAAPSQPQPPVVSVVDMPVHRPFAASPQANCPETAPQVAQGTARLGPRNLSELPPATAYMSVHRTVNGCEAPLTAVEYRQSAR